MFGPHEVSRKWGRLCRTVACDQGLFVCGARFRPISFTTTASALVVSSVAEGCASGPRGADEGIAVAAGERREERARTMGAFPQTGATAPQWLEAKCVANDGKVNEKVPEEEPEDDEDTDDTAAEGAEGEEKARFPDDDEEEDEEEAEAERVEEERVEEESRAATAECVRTEASAPQPLPPTSLTAAATAAAGEEEDSNEREEKERKGEEATKVEEPASAAAAAAPASESAGDEEGEQGKVEKGVPAAAEGAAASDNTFDSGLLFPASFHSPVPSQFSSTSSTH